MNRKKGSTERDLILGSRPVRGEWQAYRVHGLRLHRRPPGGGAGGRQGLQGQRGSGTSGRRGRQDGGV